MQTQIAAAAAAAVVVIILQPSNSKHSTIPRIKFIEYKTLLRNCNRFALQFCTLLLEKAILCTVFFYSNIESNSILAAAAAAPTIH